MYVSLVIISLHFGLINPDDRSFYALGSKGELYVWGKDYGGLVHLFSDRPLSGALDGTSYALGSDGFSEPGRSAATPLKLALPARTKSVRQADLTDTNFFAILIDL
jgi:hypothetical protein